MGLDEISRLDQKFLSGLGSTVGDLEQAIENRDWKRTFELSHRLHGAALAYRHGDLATLAKSLETASSKAMNDDPAPSERFLDTLRSIQHWVDGQLKQ